MSLMYYRINFCSVLDLSYIITSKNKSDTLLPLEFLNRSHVEKGGRTLQVDGHYATDKKEPISQINKTERLKYLYIIKCSLVPTIYMDI